MSKGVRLAVGLWLAVCLLVNGAETVPVTSGSAIRKASSFVKATYGAADALTLTTYLTNAADLHFAVVGAGHDALNAATIKDAAERCRANDLTGTESNVAKNDPFESVVAAGTAIALRAQKIEQIIGGLQPNTSYDVYFVAEVSGSNGVFGAVLSVLGSKTHPAPPHLLDMIVTPSNASSVGANMQYSLSSPGSVHLLFLPSADTRSRDLVTKEVLYHQKGFNQRPPGAVFSTDKSTDWSELHVASKVDRLLPATQYYVFVLTEAPGDGRVLSDVLERSGVFHTHAPAPDVSQLRCTPTDGSAHGLNLHFKLLLDGQSMARISEESLSFFQYDVRFTATPHSSQTAKSIQKSARYGPFASTRELESNLTEIHHHCVDGLESGLSYNVTVQVETSSSNGHFGKKQNALSCATHKEAPAVEHAQGGAKNGSVSALTMSVRLADEGNVHYVVTNALNSMRSLLRSSSTPQELLDSLLERDPNQQSKASVVMYNSAARKPKNGTSYTADFVIEDLECATNYGVALFTETPNSNGVYGKAYERLVEVTTNERASDIAIRAVSPVHGSTSSIGVEFEMAKPADIVYSCLKTGEECQEVSKTDLARIGSYHDNRFSFTIVNQTFHVPVSVSLYAENAKRNGVVSNRTMAIIARPHREAPSITSVKVQPQKASIDKVELLVESNRSGLLHFAFVEQNEDSLEQDGPITIEHVVGDKPSLRGVQFAHHRHQFSVTGTVAASVSGLKANTTYRVLAVSETSENGTASGVYGEMVETNVTTHCKAPSILNAVIDPVSDDLHSVALAINLSSPGIVHYYFTDTDFADPSILKRRMDPSFTPHELRDTLALTASDVVMEWDNVTNTTRPTSPPVFSRNLTIGGLHEATTYHVSLTTETANSEGVFGEFPPPILVTTHERAPHFLPGTLVVQPTDGSSSSISVNFKLSRLGEVHYALFFRGLQRDRSSAVVASLQSEKERLEAIEVQEKKKKDPNDTSVVHYWPPPVSAFDLTKLTARTLKDAELSDLGQGVLENGTISVSREDVFLGKWTEKVFKNVPANGLFDICLVTETVNSDGVFDWHNASYACHHIAAHMDYTNQSIFHDDIHVTAVDGATDAIQIDVYISRLIESEDELSVDELERDTEKVLSRALGRIPHYIVVNAKDGRREFSHNSFSESRRREEEPFHVAKPGYGSVVASGKILSIAEHNSTMVHVREVIHGLEGNQKYYVFVAHETWQSNGLFTKVNPCRSRLNESKTDDAIEVTTHEPPPQLSHYRAIPTYGNTTRVTLRFDVSCQACQEAIVYALLYPFGCAVPQIGDLQKLPRAAPESKGDLCGHPLVQRRLVVRMDERQTSRKNVEEDINEQLKPNTSYTVFFATETSGSNGVLSDEFVQVNFTTLREAPAFQTLDVIPRPGSTTEVMMKIQLEEPGEVHYMIGKAGNDEFNVSSPYNISSKKRPENNAPDHHQYPRDAVRLRRSTKLERLHEERVIVLDYLDPGTSYHVFVVAETLADKGVYGPVHSFYNVTTFARAPLLLAHAAFPTPGTTTSLTVGYRIDAPGLVHVSAVQTEYWSSAAHVASESDQYGNRLAIQDQLVEQRTTEIQASDMMHAKDSDSGWHEVNLTVPYAGTNYTIYLVTEVSGSDGVYGIVASHKDVSSFRDPPELVAHNVTATDARVDALTLSLTLDSPGHVLVRAFAASRQGSTNQSEKVETIDSCVDDGPCTKTFVIEGLREGTHHHLEVQTETLKSYGVRSEWIRLPTSARTHGLPPDLLEDIECNVEPSCELRGREHCSVEVNVCGSCKDGFVATSKAPNSRCVKAEDHPKSTHSSIKINRIRLNRPVHDQQKGSAGDKDASFPSISRDVTKETDGVSEIRSCPRNAELGATGSCECIPGFDLDAASNECLPRRDDNELAHTFRARAASSFGRAS